MSMFSLGQRIRELRLKKGLTQIDLAKGLCTPSMISQIESDRARPSYKMLFAIAERLDVPLEKLLVDVDLNLEYVSTYKMARAMVAGKEYASAIPLLRELLDTPRAQISTMDILFDLAECHLHIGQYEEAEKVFSQVQELAILRQDHQLLALVLKNLGLIEFHRRHYQLAAYQWQKALDESEKMEEQDVYLKGSVLYNLGLAYSRSGQVFEALEYYDRASSLYEGMDSLYEMGHVYMGLGMSFKMLGDVEKAAEYSERATSIFEGLENLLMTVKMKVTCAVLYAQTGREAEAEDLLNRAITKLRELGNREEEGIAYAELAQLRLRQQRLEEAEEACRHSRSLLPELHVYQASLNRVLGRIALQRSQRDEGLRRLQMAADGFKRLQELREWDETMYELAALYREEGDLKRVVSILDDIRRFSRQILEERGIVL
jgi:tetratricopeptide (TPR) repeat protein